LKGDSPNLQDFILCASVNFMLTGEFQCSCLHLATCSCRPTEKTRLCYSQVAEILGCGVVKDNKCFEKIDLLELSKPHKMIVMEKF